ncbi:hypothetical protein TURU_051743 [Turdus rufiventris]|nr:hypothetical protein TURU_051743 [Turdus rufiventris]
MVDFFHLCENAAASEKVTEHWKRLPREGVESLSLETFNTHLGVILCNLLQEKQVTPEVPSSSIHSVIIKARNKTEISFNPLKKVCRIRLEKTFKITESNCKPNSAKSTMFVSATSNGLV